MTYTFDDAALDVLVATQQAGKKLYKKEPNRKQIMTILTKVIATNAIAMNYEFDIFLSQLIQAFVLNKKNYNYFFEEANKNGKE